MSEAFGLSQPTIDMIVEIISNHKEVEKAIIYGSRAKGGFQNGSDIDVALVGDEELNIDVLFKIMGEMDDLLLPYTFDLSLFRFITDRDVLEHINRVGKILYSKTEFSN